jgi:hypothetical protein
MNGFQQTQLIARLRDMWTALDVDSAPLQSESRWAWCVLVGLVHEQSGCTDNRVANTFSTEMHSVGCVYDRDRFGKVIIKARRERVYGNKAIAG